MHTHTHTQVQVASCLSFCSSTKLQSCFVLGSSVAVFVCSYLFIDFRHAIFLARIQVFQPYKYLACYTYFLYY